MTFEKQENSKYNANSLESRSILLLCDYNSNTAGTIRHHIESFTRYSKHKIFVLNNLGSLPTRLELDRFDGIIIHYSIAISIDSFLSPAARKQIREFKGFKTVFVQDDYRWINRTVDALRYLGVNALFCLAGSEIIDRIYSPKRLPGVHRETVLAGYVEEEHTFRSVAPFSDREIDVGYRGRILPAWIGAHGQEKQAIADRFIADAKIWNLKVDIAYREEDRIYGEAWIQFVASCKAVLGCEGGASICDFTGEIQEKVEGYVGQHPNATFEEISDLFLKDVDGKIMMNVGTPRCFEAASLRTLMILYEGEYSGIVKPWRHYVPLKKDHSNMSEVVRVLRNAAQAEEIIDNAYREVALNPDNSFRAMVERVDEVIGQKFEPAMVRAGKAYTGLGFFHDKTKYWATATRFILERGYRLTLWGIRTFVPKSMQEPARLKVRAVVQFLRGLRASAAQQGVFFVFVLRPAYLIAIALIRVLVPRRYQKSVRLALKNAGQFFYK